MPTDYDRWLKQSLESFNRVYSDVYGTKKLDGKYPVEFSDAGHAYPHNYTGIGYVPFAVPSYESWLDNEYGVF